MKNGILWAAVVFSMIFGGTGCRSGMLNLGRNHQSHDRSIPPNSIDGYAKAHGITRAEAAKRMREKMAPPSTYGTSQPSAEVAATPSENATK
jgi:hypothetical protein